MIKTLSFSTLELSFYSILLGSLFCEKEIVCSLCNYLFLWGAPFLVEVEIVGLLPLCEVELYWFVSFFGRGDLCWLATGLSLFGRGGLWLYCLIGGCIG